MACGKMKQAVSKIDVENQQIACEGCKPGNFLEKSRCSPCPFNSWGEDGVRCNACRAGGRTNFWGKESKDSCDSEDEDKMDENKMDENKNMGKRSVSDERD